LRLPDSVWGKTLSIGACPMPDNHLSSSSSRPTFCCGSGHGIWQRERESRLTRMCLVCVGCAPPRHAHSLARRIQLQAGTPLHARNTPATSEVALCSQRSASSCLRGHVWRPPPRCSTTRLDSEFSLLVSVSLSVCVCAMNFFLSPRARSTESVSYNRNGQPIRPANNRSSGLQKHL